MKLFKRPDNAGLSDSLGGKPWERLGNHIDRHHKRFAVYMARQSEKLPLWARWSVLITFTAASACLCCYMAVSAFYGRLVPERPAVIKINRYSLLTGSETLRANTTVSENEYKKITRFKSYLDSLSGSTAGKIWVDSVLARRPGLTDSIALVENIYLSQSKK